MIANLEAPLTIAEICRHLRVGTRKVYGWIESGQLRAMNVAQDPGGKPIWRIEAGELNRFLRDR